MPPSGRPPPFRVGCALDHIPPRASPVNVWFTGWREPISISGDGKVAWRDTAPAALFFDKAGFFESLAGVVRRRSRRPGIPTCQNRGCGMVNIHDAMQAAQQRARPQKTVSVQNAPRPRKQTPRRSSPALFDAARPPLTAAINSRPEPGEASSQTG